jgi:cardiolipin synthase
MSAWLIWCLVAHGLLTVPCVVVLLRHQRPPQSAVAWLMSLLMLPLAGPVLFLLFGLNRVTRDRRFRRRRRGQGDRRRKTHPPTPELEPQPRRFQQRATELTRRLSGGDPTSGNSVELLAESQAAFDAMEASIKQARQFIHVEYYIYRPDRVGTRIRDLLIQKARQGVKVRFLYDGIGSWGLSRAFLRPMRDCGIATAPFLSGRGLSDKWSFNLRNHRKLVIVDNQVAYTGGLNVGDEYLGRNPAWGYWRDTQLQLRGPVVGELAEVFAEDWSVSTGERLDPMPDQHPPQAGGGGGVQAHVIADGPDRSARPLRMVLLSVLLEAERSITLSTGYFVPPPALQEALRTAAARGVRVRVLVAGPSTYWYTLWAGRSYYQELLDAGAEVYEYEKGLFHAKVVTIDGCWSLVGTPNFDFRSLDLNFEVAVAFADETVASELEVQFAGDVAEARRIDRDHWSRRSLWRICGENFCRLFAPLL